MKLSNTFNEKIKCHINDNIIIDKSNSSIDNKSQRCIKNKNGKYMHSNIITILF